MVSDGGVSFCDASSLDESLQHVHLKSRRFGFFIFGDYCLLNRLPLSPASKLDWCKVFGQFGLFAPEVGLVEFFGFFHWVGLVGISQLPAIIKNDAMVRMMM